MNLNPSVKNRFYTTIRIFTILCLTASKLTAQLSDSTIASLINQVDLDRLSSHVRALSGVDTIRVNRINTVITSRRVGEQGHADAIEYLVMKLKEYGYSTDQTSFYRGETHVQNLFASHPGVTDPDHYYILSAHYDTYNRNTADPAPGAEDNAGGVAAVLETARILYNFETDYTVKFAFWDAEELGLLGSENYAFKESRLEESNLLGVVNLDMIAYTTDSLWQYSINTRDTANSIEMSDLVYSLSTSYFDSLYPIVYNPGLLGSDHRRFWEYGFSAIFIGEAFRTVDYPYYHTANDTYDKLNLPFFHDMTKLVLASITHLATSSESEVYPQASLVASEIILNQNYPNPFNHHTIISYVLNNSGQTILALYNLNGAVVLHLVDDYQTAGVYHLPLDASSLASGVYYYQLRQNKQSFTRSMMLLK
ncbi:M28 family peptidase [bacterium]|nr:M28 family peptidase [bacterium]MBU1065086.1 M28 family peptidase [bacterium]MBU1635146.1 M28 family peptidase [bacterium]MBU1872852.1 M28 family peptidase [bacterium]